MARSDVTIRFSESTPAFAYPVGAESAGEASAASANQTANSIQVPITGTDTFAQAGPLGLYLLQVPSPLEVPLGGSVDMSQFIVDPGGLRQSTDVLNTNNTSYDPVTELLLGDTEGSDPGLQLVVNTQDDFPLFSVYSGIVNFRGGTPVPESNTRYWDDPVYPTFDGGNPDHTLATSIGALNTAIAGAGAGDFIFLQDGVYNNPGQITLANNGNGANPIHFCAQTKNGVEFQNDAEVKINGDFWTVLGINYSGNNGEVNDDEGIFTVNGSDNVIAYSRQFNLSGNNANNNLWNVYFYGPRNRACFITIDTKLCDRACFRGKSNADYTRVDHCRDIGHNGTGDSGDIEFVQTHQDSAADDGFWLVDNNYIFEANNNNGVPNRSSEREVMTLKNSTNMVIQNVLVDCCGTIMDRTSDRSTHYANWILGTNNTQKVGGMNLSGEDSYSFFNYIEGANPSDDSGTPAIGFVDGGGSYEQSVRSEASFNTVIDSARSLSFGVPGGGGAAPANPSVYNTAIDYQAADGECITPGNFTNDTWGGNVFKAPSGIAAEAGILEATPQLTLTDGYYTPTPGGNCDATGVSGHHQLCTVDILGNPVPGTNPNVGCFQPGWDLSNDPRQAIIDKAGT